MLRKLLYVAIAGIAIVAYLYVFDRTRLERWLEDTPLALPATGAKAYKWQDPGGRWHLTGDPPPVGTPYEILRYRGDENTLPAAD